MRAVGSTGQLPWEYVTMLMGMRYYVNGNMRLCERYGIMGSMV